MTKTRQPLSDRQKLIRLHAYVSSIRDGGGEASGVGTAVDASGDSRNGISMTDATECYGGMSGRGNRSIKANIELLPRTGLVRIVKKGRTQRVYLTAAGYAFLKENTDLEENI